MILTQPPPTFLGISNGSVVISIVMVKGAKLEAGVVDAVGTVAVAVAVVDTEVETESDTEVELEVETDVEMEVETEVRGMVLHRRMAREAKLRSIPMHAIILTLFLKDILKAMMFIS